MKYCVMHNLRVETPAKRDKLDGEVKAWIGKKKVWGEASISSSQDEEGYQIHSLEIRFERKVNMDDLFTLIKDKVEKIPVLKGTLTKHNCTHDEATPQPCEIIEEYSKG